MRFGDLPFTTTDWAAVAPTTHPGTTGVATWRTVQAGDIRVRMVTRVAPDAGASCTMP